ncbi:Neuroendocrine convertase 2 [Eumeta japonica]|uniref:Neuroendocrine convertase 2 n=1 Tax=Eumeta variegata TaxID=151549 RepID=A0A4C1TJ38_EUMVA|nr:Neuroendocrine convertase 2 [Eumeta japonica]
MGIVTGTSIRIETIRLRIFTPPSSSTLHAGPVRVQGLLAIVIADEVATSRTAGNTCSLKYEADGLTRLTSYNSFFYSPVVWAYFCLISVLKVPNAVVHYTDLQSGRNGLGNIYVWASGDGGEDDDCNCDGYAASMWTVSINSAINDGQNAHYDESCSSTLASTFSNGARDPSTGVATTDLYGKCTATHSGTSAAAPEAAGVFALALHANPNLTWRDIQHLTVLTSKRNSLYDAKGRFHWTMNGVGLEFNHLFGFGVLDAGAMTALAASWRSVPPRYHCEAGAVNTHTCLDHVIKDRKSVRRKMNFFSFASIDVNLNRGLAFDSYSGCIFDYIFDSDPDPTLVLDPDLNLNFSSDFAFDSDPGPVPDSALRLAFKSDSATSNNSNLYEAEMLVSK